MTCTFDDFEREEAMNNLGDAVYDCNMDLDEFMDMFIAAGMAREYVLSGKDWMYYIHCLLIEIILYKYGSS